jgi:hypothetical protein
MNRPPDCAWRKEVNDQAARSHCRPARREGEFVFVDGGSM